MEIKIYDSSITEDKTITLRLIHETDGVWLMVVDQEGRSIPGGHILSISKRGLLTIASSLSKRTGLLIGEKHTGIAIEFEGK